MVKNAWSTCVVNMHGQHAWSTAYYGHPNPTQIPTPHTHTHTTCRPTPHTNVHLPTHPRTYHRCFMVNSRASLDARSPAYRCINALERNSPASADALAAAVGRLVSDATSCSLCVLLWEGVCGWALLWVIRCSSNTHHSMNYIVFTQRIIIPQTQHISTFTTCSSGSFLSASIGLL